ncbi:NAD(P)/FAD-dependent oxidoreductase [Frondihabitans australicus]|uniref:Apoptosis-inducing factor-like protein n=1 Tax=Frondihabitans australicus TaxID=386892 RepID=A0A495IGL4_9MICO|nr:FAD-dependent oxidoreductase [Frondihabitans australicus]RKR74558.1 apoptosis-inducing factor-like protein [Frondihabitans australicus]
MADDYDYLIVGGGMVADAAARGIRERDASGSILILSDDVDEPYTRPALSKKLWTDPDFAWADNDLHTAAETGAEIRLSTHVDRIDRAARTITTGTGETVGYGRLLLATGGRPKTLDLPDDDGVIYFRTASDYRHLRDLAGSGRHVAVVGGGYIGSEIAAALAQNDTRVTIVFPDDDLGGSTFPADVDERFESRFRDHGVSFLAGRRLASAAASGDGFTLTLDDGSTLDADGVVIGLGIEPNTDLASGAGLQVDDGIVVDARLATSDPFVYAAGDAANYPDPILGRRRVEHVDNAQEQGAVVGRIMAGSDEKYTHTPMYYSDVFDLGYEAVGRLDSSLETVEDWKDDDSVVVYYLDDGVPVGVLLWNVWDSTDKARQVLAEGSALTADNLVGMI